MDRSTFTCLALSLAIGIAASLSPVQAESGMRCGTKLVGEGDSTYVVRQKCGDPVEARSRIELRSVSSAQQLPGGRWVQVSRTVEVPIDEWLYDFGANRFLRRVVFEHGRLVNVETEGYGSPK
jgi:hypothetical protein